MHIHIPYSMTTAMVKPVAITHATFQHTTLYEFLSAPLLHMARTFIETFIRRETTSKSSFPRLEDADTLYHTA